MSQTIALPSERVLEEIEQLAILVDQLEAQGDEATAFAKRQRLLIELEVAQLLAGGPVTSQQLEKFPMILAYYHASLLLASYQTSQERLKMMQTWPEFNPAQQHVSLDWFRQLSTSVPAGFTPFQWLALCERNFCDPMPKDTGTRFVKIAGALRILYYRREVERQPKLYRVEFETETASSHDELGFGDPQATAQTLLVMMNQTISHQEQVYQAQKERDDRKSLLEFYIQSGQIEEVPKLIRVASQLADMIELTIESGATAPMSLDLTYRDRTGKLSYVDSPNKIGRTSSRCRFEPSPVSQPPRPS